MFLNLEAALCFPVVMFVGSCSQDSAVMTKDGLTD